MNKKITTKDIALSGLLLSMGILLPMIFHVFGMTGPIALPMHIPVLLGGFLLPTNLALLLGIITPIISGLLTGMPVMFPMAVIMAFELGMYGFTASIVTKKFNVSNLLSLLVSMVSGRITAVFVVAIMVQFFGVKMNPIIYLKGAVITGIPGVIIQLIFIPPLVYAIRRFIAKSSINA